MSMYRHSMSVLVIGGNTCRREGETLGIHLETLGTRIKTVEKMDACRYVCMQREREAADMYDDACRYV